MVGQCGTGPVVDHLAAAADGTMFQEIDAQALAAPEDVLRAHAILAQEIAAGLAEVVVGQAGDVLGVETEIGQRDRHVALAAAVDHVEAIGLRKAQVVRRRQPHHDFAEGYDFGHGVLQMREFWVRKTILDYAP